MLSITQYEVYAYDRGRWTLHARHGSDQRKAAIMDARTTEFSTGRPTKVVVETYFPETGESELVTAFVSPKARELQEAARLRRASKAPAAARSSRAGANAAAGASPTPSAAKPPRPSPGQRISVRQYVLKGIVAVAFSLVGATISTLLISWGLKRSIDAGLPVSSSLMPTILTYAYAVFFLFFFMSLFRSRLPLHQLISYLWAPSEALNEKPAETIKSIAAAIAPKLRAKQSPAAAEAKAAQAREELKALRGDPQQELNRAEAEVQTVAPQAPRK